MSRVSLIAAIGARTRALGKGNALLWHLPSDLQFFKHTTTGHPIIMGRKTYLSIGRALPNRTNIVLTRDPVCDAPGCTVAHSLDEALKVAPESDEVFVIGGGDVYAQALPRADRLYLTLVDDAGEGADVFFPPYETEFTKILSSEEGEENGLHFRRVTLER